MNDPKWIGTFIGGISRVIDAICEAMYEGMPHDLGSKAINAILKVQDEVIDHYNNLSPESHPPY